MHAHSRSRKRTLDQAEEEVVVAKEVFEEVLVEEKVKEEALIVMGEPEGNMKALMDYSQPKINDIQSSIVPNNSKSEASKPSLTPEEIKIKAQELKIKMPKTYVVHLGNSNELMEVVEDRVAKRILREHVREALGV
ncbi:hypothetical protein AgCh_016973 [Apium graveolens]